ncbi:MAG: hypothetical protein JWL75_591 [Parcubacteria group bacterium]|nr:hypothetical protein [Parcubacteria group bacterium]
MSEEPPKDLRDFTRKHASEARSSLAAEMQETRKEYFSHQQQTSESLDRLYKEAEAKQRESLGVIEEIEAIEEELLNTRTSKYSEFIHYFKLKSLQDRLKTKEHDRGQTEEDYSTLQSSISELENLRQENSSLDQAREKLGDFYKDQNETWNLYQEERKATDITEIRKKYGVTFIHAIRPDVTPGMDNSLLNTWASWKQKLDVLLTLEPTISTSTVKEGADNMWGRMGVILSGGRVVDASPSDLGTVAKGVKTRMTHSERFATITDKIESSINRNRDNHPGYNELVVEDPQVAGFYISPDKYSGLPDLVSDEEIHDSLKDSGMKIFHLRNGKVHATHYDKDKKVFIPDEENLDPEALEEGYVTSREVKKLALEELMADAPFKISSPEVRYVDSSSQGKEFYLNLQIPQFLPNAAPKESEFEFTEFNQGYQIPKGSKIQLLTEFASVGQVHKYFLFEGAAYIQTVDTHKGKSKTEPIGNKATEASSHIFIGLTSYDFEKQIIDTETYLSSMEQKINSILERSDEDNEFREEIGRKLLEGRIQDVHNLAFHLYGFAEEAEKFNDLESAKRARSIAEKVMGHSEYKETIIRRVDDKGRLKITTADIPGYQE